MASGSFGFIRLAGTLLALASVARGTKPTLRGRPSMPMAQPPPGPSGLPTNQQSGLPTDEQLGLSKKPFGTFTDQPFGSSMVQPWASWIPVIEPGCGDASDKDMAEPIRQARWGNKDGFCHFATRVPWLRGCSAARRDRDYVTYAKNMGAHYSTMMMVGTNPHWRLPPNPLGFFYGGGTKLIYTQLNLWPLEDAYCVTNGWVDVPDSLVQNTTSLEEFASLECKSLALEHPEFMRTSMNELTALMELNNNQLLTTLQSQAGTTPGPTIADLKRHAIARCLLGGLECDIANCARNFCHRDDLGFHYIGHSFLQCQATKLQD